MNEINPQEQLLSFLQMRPKIRAHLRSFIVVIFSLGVAVGVIVMAVFSRVEHYPQ